MVLVFQVELFEQFADKGSVFDSEKHYSWHISSIKAP